MKTFIKRNWAFAAVLALLLCALSLACVTMTVHAEGESIQMASQLFAGDKGIRLSDDRKISADSEVEDRRTGLLIESTDSQAVATTVRPLSGVFEMDFRIFSQSKGIRDVGQVFITVTDAETGRYFTYRIDARSPDYKTYAFTSLYVDDDFTQSYAFIENRQPDAPDGIIRGTANNSAEGNRLYTTVTFNNLMEADSNSRTVSGHIRFDPRNMEVQVLTQKNWYRMADLDDPDMMRTAAGGILTGFERYNVSIRLELEAPSLRTGKFLIYSLNGQELASPRSGITNTAGPDVMVKTDNSAVVGYSYTLPKPTVCDVIDGKLDYTGVPTVTGPDGKAVAVTGGAFTPETEGEYTIAYPLTDVKDKAFTPRSALEHTYYNTKLGTFSPFTDGCLITKLNVLAEHPGAAEVVLAESPATFAATGTPFALPAATAVDPLGKADTALLPVSLTVTKAGGDDTVFTSKDMKQGASFTFTEDGEYTLTYTATDVAGVKGEQRFTVDVSSAYPVFTVPAYSAEIGRGDTFTVPDVTAKIGGQNVAVQSFVTLPDGTELQEKQFTAEQVGTYIVTYSCSVSDKTFSKQIAVQVSTLVGSLFTAGKNMTVTTNVAGPAYTGKWDDVTPLNGVRLVASGNNATVTFNNILNLNACTTERPLIEFIVTPDVIGKYEFSYLNFRFTDIYDSDNYMDVNVIPNTSREYDYASLVKASTRGETVGGKGWSGIVGTASYAGTDLTTSFHGHPVSRSNVLDKLVHPGKIYFDYATKCLYTDHPGGLHGSALEGLGLNLVIDLDDPNDVGAGKEWINGFTTGEVRLTITMSDLTGKSASMLLLGLDGISLSGDKAQSGRTPYFAIDKRGESTSPQGQVGKKYPVFNAEVRDLIDGNLAFGTEVYFAYGEDGQKKIDIATDNTFTPAQTGTYTIVYRSGKFSHTEQVTIVDALDELTYAFDTAPILTGYVGQRVQIPSGTVTGGSGQNKTVQTTVTRLVGDGEPIDMIDSSFLPMQQGKYRIAVTVTDFLGQTVTEQYDMKITFTRQPVITKLPSIPKVIQVGSRFVFPTMEGIDYFSDKTQAHNVVASVLVNGQALAADRSYTPAKAETLEVVYRLCSRFDPTIYEERSFTVKAVDFAGQYKESYFYPTGTFTQIGHTEQFAFFETRSEAAGLYFANALLANSFTMNFRIPTASLGGVRFVFTDAQNALIKVQVEIRNEGDGVAVLYVNGVRGGRMSGEFGNTEKPFVLGYDNKSFTFTNKSGAEVGKVLTTLTSEVFEGFTSGKFYMEMSLIGIESSSRIEVSDLSGQSFNDMKTDRIAPLIEIDGKVPLSAEFGDVINLPYAVAGDVLCAESTVFVTVSGPGGVNLIDKAPVTHGMSFKADRYGSYVITYDGYDEKGNNRKSVFSMLVTDKVPPVITLLGTMPDSGNVNKAITVPQAEITDNIDTGLTLYLYVLDTQGKMTAIENYTFTPDKKGVYTVYYYAKDSSFSYCYRSYTVTVA